MKDKITKISQVTPEVTFFLRELGFSNYYIIKMFAIYNDSIIELIKDNPYFLLEDFPKIGFKKIDEISIKLGFNTSNSYRTEAGIKYVLASYISNGNTYVPYKSLISDVTSYLEITEHEVEESVYDLTLSGELQISNVKNEKAVYFYSYFKAESNVAKNLRRINDSSNNLYKVVSNYLERLDAFENQNDIKLSENQRLAITSTINNPISIITGGPGTGKTTIINAICDIFEASGMKVGLCAPTGRASKRIMETSKRFSQTVHRILGYYYDEELDRMAFYFNEENKLKYNAIIVDESSMLDLMLTSSLLDAIESGTRLILVGDKNQLPSVGAGNVLSDILDSGFFNVTTLSKIYRQDNESKIISNAYRINNGDYPEFGESDFELVRSDSFDGIKEKILDVASKYNIRDIQVLTPVKKSKIGVVELNESLQEIFNPKDEKVDELPFGKKYFRVGDRVMQTKNNYSLEYKAISTSSFAYTNNPLQSIGELSDLRDGQGVFNGEIGEIVSIDKEERSITILYDEERFVKYEYVNLDEIEHAYAITIHKSQGSEFPIVIIPMSYFPPVLSTRSLIYTAITRGKKKVYIVGNPDYMNRMIDNNESGKRYSGLVERIDNLMYLCG